MDIANLSAIISRLRCLSPKVVPRLRDRMPEPVDVCGLTIKGQSAMKRHRTRRCTLLRGAMYQVFQCREQAFCNDNCLYCKCKHGDNVLTNQYGPECPHNPYPRGVGSANLLQTYPSRDSVSAKKRREKLFEEKLFFLSAESHARNRRRNFPFFSRNNILST